MSEEHHKRLFNGTTILSIRDEFGSVVIACDGQVTRGETKVKSTANKLRVLADNKVLAGFAGSASDAGALFERLETKLSIYTGQLLRAVGEMAKDWRTDKYLRKLDAIMIVADAKVTLIVSGAGDILEPEDGIASVGSGGNYALAAAKAAIKARPDMPIEEIARLAMGIAADICVYTNHNITIKKLSDGVLS